MYRVRSRWTGLMALFVLILLILYAALLFGGKGDETTNRNGAARWFQSLREELHISKPASEDLGWELVLVNDRYTVPDSYPEDLTTLKNGKKVDTRICEAKKMAREWVALPGHSEHELGLAVDINAEDSGQKDELYHWLNENSWKYGFICRYPDNKSDITHVEHEPWHYRYVGKGHAKTIHEKGYCLEEYIDELNNTAS